MKAYRTLVKSSLLAFVSLLSIDTQARISEPKMLIENRFKSKTNGAIFYSTKEEAYREAMELPYKYMFLLYPKDTDNYFLFKRANNTNTLDSDVINQNDLYGWEINISLHQNKSAVEFYRKHGDPFTFEELKNLFNAQIAGKKDVIWKKTQFIETVRNWEIEIDGRTPVYSVKDTKNVEDILPKSPDRFIYIQPPDNVSNSINFNTSLQKQILVEEQRLAYDTYNEHVSSQRTQIAEKTKRKTSSSSSSTSNLKKVYSAETYTHKTQTSEIFVPSSEKENSTDLTIAKYKLTDLTYGATALTSPTKEVRLSMNIPNQPDTAFGYDYETSDGKIRAKLYKKGVLFLDTKFDQTVRAHMENLRKKQATSRIQEGKDSTSKF